MIGFRAVLVDDHPILREGLAVVLSGLGVKVVGVGRTGEEALELVRKLTPELVIMDVTLDGMNGIEATRRITSALGHRPNVLILSMHRSADTVQRALSAGARGYLLKSAGLEELVQAVSAIFRGEIYITSRVGPVRPVDGEPSAEPEVLLSARENEILALVADGLSSKQIATQLGLSPRTVDNHRANMMLKLRTNTTAGLIRHYYSRKRQP